MGDASIVRHSSVSGAHNSLHSWRCMMHAPIILSLRLTVTFRERIGPGGYNRTVPRHTRVHCKVAARVAWGMGLRCCLLPSSGAEFLRNLYVTLIRR